MSIIEGTAEMSQAQAKKMFNPPNEPPSPPPKSLERYLTVKEVAQYLKRRPRTIYRWLDEGIIKGKKVRNRWYIPVSEIVRLLDGYEHEVDPDTSVTHPVLERNLRKKFRKN